MLQRKEVKQMTTTIEKNEIVIRLLVDPNPPPSASGKTRVVATTRGFIGTTAVVAGKPVSISVNATIPR
jgi:hypothetical protein